ncbi:MAG TPA: DUF6064 family protein [Polaromonas sp.]|jgi:hypothetical protein
MSEWWTYRLSDFLMFSPRTYWRLVELYNHDVWPAQLAALAVGLWAIWLAASQRAGAGRVLAALLAAAWLWVGWAFHWQRYATINWAAQYFALAFAVHAGLLVGLGVLRSDTHAPPAGGAMQNLGWLLAITGVVLYPLAGLLAGRPWSQAEVFGTAPEPTALASLGLLLASGYPPSRARRCLLAVIPTLSLLIGAATLWLMAA